MNTHLSGKVVVITGASGGIGSAIAKQFTAEGAKLTLHYRSGKARVAALQRELGNAESLVVRADLTDESQAKQLFAQTVKRFGRVDTPQTPLTAEERIVGTYTLRHRHRVMSSIPTTYFQRLNMIAIIRFGEGGCDCCIVEEENRCAENRSDNAIYSRKHKGFAKACSWSEQA